MLYRDEASGRAQELSGARYAEHATAVPLHRNDDVPVPRESRRDFRNSEPLRHFGRPAHHSQKRPHSEQSTVREIDADTVCAKPRHDRFCAQALAAHGGAHDVQRI